MAADRFCWSHRCSQNSQSRSGFRLGESYVLKALKLPVLCKFNWPYPGQF